MAYLKLIKLSFKLILAFGLICFSVLILPEFFFGDFHPQPKRFTGVDLPDDFKVIQATNDQITSLNLDRQVIESVCIKFYKEFIYAGTRNGQILKIDEKNEKTTILTTLVDEEAKNCMYF